MSQATFILGDVFDAMDTIEPGTIDLIGCSPPFLALRSYLPADHPDKAKEIGAEPDPLSFLDTLLALTERFGVLLTATGSIFVELGDTYSGSGGGGGDYLPGGMREGQAQFAGSAATARESNAAHWRQKNANAAAWPLAKSLCGIPHLYHLSLAYGRNLLRSPLSASQLLAETERMVADMPTMPAAELLAMMRLAIEQHASNAGQVVEFEPWLVRNVVAWCRPNPSVGELGDKFRPATSYMTIATRNKARYFDLDAVRRPADPKNKRTSQLVRKGIGGRTDQVCNPLDSDGQRIISNPAGAPPHDDWWIDDDDQLEPDHDLFEQDAWLVPTQPYKGQHYATWPKRLLVDPIEAMCPRQVCTTCGAPRRRIVERTRNLTGTTESPYQREQKGKGRNGGTFASDSAALKITRTELGWSHCGCGDGCRPTLFERVDVLTDPEVTPDGIEVAPATKKAKLVCTDIGECNDPTHWRRGVVLDPFGGSGTTAVVATGLGRDCILIDIDERNVDLARQRVGMFLAEKTTKATGKKPTKAPAKKAAGTKKAPAKATAKRPARKPKAT